MKSLKMYFEYRILMNDGLGCWGWPPDGINNQDSRGALYWDTQSWLD